MDVALIKAAYHEAAHCVSALHFALPLSDVTISPTGCGLTRYQRWFGHGEVESWIVTCLAGPLCESMNFGDAVTDGDTMAINAMLRDLRLDWNSDHMDIFRREAQALIEASQPAIRCIAHELLARRRLSGDEIASMLRVEQPAATLWVT